MRARPFRPSLLASVGTSRPLRSGLLASTAVALTLAAVAPSAASADDLRVVPVTGTSPGVVLSGTGDVVLKSSLRRASPRGRALGVTCLQAPDPRATTRRETGTETPLTKGARRVSVPPGGDWCVVTLTTKRSRGQETKPIAGLYRNARGLDALYEQSVAGFMTLASELASGTLTGKPVTVPRVVEALRGTRVIGRRLTPVAIPAAGTPVKTGQLGVWADGPRVSVTARTPGGRALYLDYDVSDRAISTNILEALTDSRLGASGTAGAGR